MSELSCFRQMPPSSLMLRASSSCSCGTAFTRAFERGCLFKCITGFGGACLVRGWNCARSSSACHSSLTSTTTMAFLGDVSMQGPHTAVWLMAGSEENALVSVHDLHMTLFLKLALEANGILPFIRAAAASSRPQDLGACKRCAYFYCTSADLREQRTLLGTICVLNEVGRGCSPRVAFNIATFATKPGRPARPPEPVTVERDGARIVLPADPLMEPIFCTLHRLGDVFLSVSVPSVLMRERCQGADDDVASHVGRCPVLRVCGDGANGHA